MKNKILNLIALLSFPASIAWAAPSIPPPIPGWTHQQKLSGDSEARHGIILDGGDVTYSAPLIAEIDGNAANGLETAVGGADGKLHVYGADGSLRWVASAPNESCNGASSMNKLLSSPAAGPIYGDGMPYVLVGYGGVGGRACDGGMVAFRGSDGATAWIFSLKAFAKKEKYGTLSYSVFSTPAIADTDADGKMEIGFGGFDRNVYLLNADGSVRWYYNAADSIWSSPLFINVDRDPKLEMVIGTDISGNTRIKPITKDGGYVYAFKTTTRKKKKISFRDKSAFLWQHAFDQVIYSAPVAADVLSSNPGAEIIVGSGCFFPQGKNAKRGRWVKILAASSGKILKTLETTACLSSSPAAGDLDGDGNLEVVATVNGSTAVGGDGQSRLMAWKQGELLWSVSPQDRGRSDPYFGNFKSPVLADLDGNGSLEVIVANNASVGIFNGHDGSALTCQDRDCDTLALPTSKVLQSTPAVADVNGDGVLDLIAAGGHSGASGHGALFGWTNFAGILHSSSGTAAPYLAPWPMYRVHPTRNASKD